MDVSRRAMIGSAAALPLVGAIAPTLAATTRPLAPTDDAGWAKVAKQYDVTREVIQLENAYWGMMAKPVQAAYAENLAQVNRRASFWARRTMIGDLEGVRARVAAALAVSPQEIMLTRNATEALKNLIGNYNRLRPGDAVLYADLDYDSMQASFASLERRRGVQVVRIALPEPASHQAILDAYARALTDNPKVRLILLTHLSHRTGLVVPVRDIVAMARARGVDCIVDAAHSWGQLDFTLPDLDADFVGLNLHKWMGAPLGAGIFYCRKSRIHDIDPDIATEGAAPDSIDARIHTGTLDFASHLTVPAALDFQASIGGKPKEARLRHLRGLWAEELRDLDGLQILTPTDDRLHCGITSFRIRGQTSVADNIALVERLLADHRIFTVHRPGPKAGACIRVTPGIFTSPRDVQALVVALKQIVPEMKRSV